MGWILFNSLSFLLPTIFLINDPIMKIPRSPNPLSQLG
jgi:hypothetical protein